MPARKKETVKTSSNNELSFVNIQLRLSATDSTDTAIDSNGVLRPGRFVSPHSLVQEVNRLLADGYKLLFIAPIGQEKIGANITAVNVKVIMAKGGDFIPQNRFSFLLISESSVTLNEWQEEMAKRYNAGFGLFGQPVAVAYDRTGVNMWYAFIK